MNIKRTTLLMLTLFVVLTTVSAISAASDDSAVATDDSQSVSVDTAISSDTSSSDTSSASSSSSSDVSSSTPTKAVDTQKTTASSSTDKVSADSSSSNTVSSDTTSSSQSTTTKDSSESATVKTTDSQDTNNANDNSKEINSVKTSTVDTNKTTKSASTHIVNSETIEDIFDFEQTNGPLTDLVSEGDTLDIQGTIELHNQSLTINKAVNVISSTNDGNISLDSVAGSYFGEDPGSSFIINNEGSYTNVTGINFYNTQIWIYNASYVTLDNITVNVINQRVGSGNGHTSIREGSEYVTVKNSYFYTENNDGSSSVVLAGANYCTIDNNTFAGKGDIGDFIYITSFNTETDTTNLNQYNNITNNKITGPDEVSTCWGIVATGSHNYVANNTVDYDGVCFDVQSGQFYANDTLVENNVFSMTGTSYIPGNATYINNTLGNIITMADNAYVENCSINSANMNKAGNTITKSTIHNITGLAANNTVENCIIEGNVSSTTTTAAYSNGTLINNTIGGNILINNNVTIVDNTINGNITLNAYSKASQVVNNTINGMVTLNGTGNNLEENNITTNSEYAVNITAANNTVINNRLIANTFVGNAAVITSNSEVVIENNTPESTSIVINNTSYSEYFDENGNVIASIPDYSTLILSGEITDKNFTFTNEIVTLQAEDSNTQLKGVTITSKDNAKVTLQNLKINNTGYDIESAIVFESDYNIIDTCDIYYYTETTNSMLVVFEGNNNQIIKSNITLYGISGDIDYSTSPQIATTVAIAVFSSGNVIDLNNITTNTTVNTSPSNWGTVESITVQQKNSDVVMENNTITNNNITTEGPNYVYGINLLDNSNYNNVSKNTIKTFASTSATGIQIGSDPANNNIFGSNTINSTADETAYGIVISGYNGLTLNNNNISSNTLNIKADQAYGIEIYISPGLTEVKNTTVRSNTININGSYSMGIGLYEVSDITLASNTISVNGTSNETASSYDYIKPRTAGIVLESCGDNIVIANNTKLNISNGVGISVNNTNGVSITNNNINSTNSATILLNSSNNSYINSNTMKTSVTGLLIEDSTSNNITFNKINSTDVEYTIIADTTSTGNSILNNSLRAEEKAGDNAVNTENSDNTVKYNDPNTIIITDDNYSTYFDENGVFDNEYASGNTTIILGSDLYNKDLIFNKNITLDNPDGYTIYNSTITLNDTITGNATNLYNLKINVTDGRESVIIINTSNSTIKNCTIYQYNENTSARTIYVGATGSAYNISNNNITTYGAEIKTDDGTPSLAIIYEASENPRSDSTSQPSGNYYIEAVYSDGEGITAGIYSTYRESSRKFSDLNLTVIGDNCAIGTSMNTLYINNSCITVTSNNEAIGYRIYNENNNYDTYILNSTITVTAPNNAIGVLVENTNRFNASNLTLKVTSNNTATGILLINSGRGTAAYRLYYSDIEVTAPKAVGLNFTNSSLEITNNTITVNGDIAQAIIDSDGYYTSGINITNNTINVKTTDPTTAVELVNMTSTRFINNTVETNSNAQYVITVTDSDGVNITTNNISKNGKLVGDTGVGVTNSENVIVENNPYYDTIVVVTVPEEAKVGSTITLTATVSVYDNTVNNGYVIFKVNGKTLKDADGKVIEVPVIDGVATYNYTVPATSTSIYTVSAVYNGEYGVARSDNTTFTSIPIVASIELTTTGTLMPGQTVTFTAYITDEFGNTVTSGKVVFKLNGVSLKDANGNVIYAYVDENGYASINYTIPDNFSAKDYVLSAVFQATGFERTETNDTITISKATPTIVPDSSVFGTNNTITITQGTESVQVKATIIDPDTQAPITTTTVVTIKINDKTVTQEYVSNGQIDMTIYTSSFKNPEYNITIVVGENSQYNRVSYNGTLEILTPNGLATDSSYNGTLLVAKD